MRLAMAHEPVELLWNPIRKVWVCSLDALGVFVGAPFACGHYISHKRHTLEGEAHRGRLVYGGKRPGRRRGVGGSGPQQQTAALPLRRAFVSFPLLDCRTG